METETARKGRVLDDELLRYEMEVHKRIVENGNCDEIVGSVTWILIRILGSEMSRKKIKRVGIDAHMLGDCSGGNETYYRNILENMEVPENMEIYVFVTKKADVSKIENKFNIVYFSDHGAVYRNVIELPMICIKYKLDLLHVQYFIPFIRPCKVVTTIHDICFEHYKDIFTKREYIRQKLLIPYAAKKSKVIFTVSEFCKRDIVKCYNIKPERIIITYNGVGDEFRPLSEDEINRDGLRRQYGIDGNFILSVGNLQPRKNIVRLVKAYKLLKREYAKQIQLVIVGKKAWMYDDIFEEADKSSKDIIFTGYVDKDDLVRLYCGANCFVYPSLFEGFGIPPVEALACGTPVAVSNTSSLPEVVGRSGVYFNPNSEEDIKNAIVRLLTSIDIPNKSVEKCDFWWEESSKKIVEVYKRLLDANRY